MVKLLQPNGYGLYDMSGNSFEWVWDWYNSITDATPADGPESGSYGCRSLRGGSWYTSSKQECEISYRDGAGSDKPYLLGYDYGFRVVRTAN